VIALDANIVVRILTKDEPSQFAAALKLVEDNDVYLASASFQETGWVLIKRYGFNREAVVFGLRQFLGLPNLTVWNRQTAELTLALFQHGMEFGDAAQLASCNGAASSLATFDKAFARKAKSINTETSVLAL
jgi:predicted nucleic acid-binding protein